MSAALEPPRGGNTTAASPAAGLSGCLHLPLPADLELTAQAGRDGDAAASTPATLQAARSRPARAHENG
ncbi:hypothetical protein AB0F88_17310 [Streptosporangium sp. NPDC023963]|uniref:hypothetical protein n=1 Tax=Streptosporangium sp. NPDC023963 TaxID=3155608 RepID=UPI00342D0A6B